MAEKFLNLTAITAKQVRGGGLLSLDQFQQAQEIVLYMNLITSVFGIFTNLSNLYVYLCIGLRGNSPNISFLVLTTCDLMYLILVCSAMIFRMLSYITKSQDFPYLMFAYFLLLYSVCVNNISSAITVYLAIQKCCCVAMPFHFKNTFTPPQTVSNIVMIVIVILVFHIPGFSLHNIARQWNPVTNSSSIVAWLSPVTSSMALYDNIFLFNFVPLSYQITIIVCVVILLCKLKESTRFRQRSSTAIPGPKATGQLTGRELQVVMSVTLVATLFEACNLPLLLFTYIRFIEPELDNGKQYAYIYVIANNLRITLQVICASFNFFIYFKYNSNFRSKVKTICKL